MVRLSTIKPESGPKKPSMKFNDKTYQSYVDNGFADSIPNDVEFPVKQKREFLSRVDESKEPVKRKVTKIVRVKALDSSSKKYEKKEYLYYWEEWSGKNWLGQTIDPPSEHMEGFWDEQEKEPVVKQNQKGEYEVVGYKRSGQHRVYDIPFSKEAVDKIIEKSVGTDKGSIIFLVKEGIRRDEFTYDEFVNYSWDELVDILLTDGAYKRRIKRALEAQTKGQ